MRNVADIKGIGPKTVGLLNKINIFTTNDLLEHFPFRYEIIKRTNLNELENEDKAIVDGKIESVPILLHFRTGFNKMNFRLLTANGPVGISIFNRAFLKNNLKIGTNVIAIGKYDKFKNVITAADLQFGLLNSEEKLLPVYHATSGLTNKNLNTYINTALLFYHKDIIDNIPLYLMDKYKFLNKKTALNIVHNPPNMNKLKEAMVRLKYEELFAFMLKINYLKVEHQKEAAGITRNINQEALGEIIKKIPFQLTADQKIVLNEIIKDLNSKRRMNRLLQGDVGSGKTIVSIIAMYLNALSGYQSALMAPTEILATQHYNNIKDLLGKINANINVELITGSLNKKLKNSIYEDLASGKINIIIGTHTLIQDEITYQNLGLVVTDEQHRFGVMQRMALRNKGVAPDVLYMSATPIPRTYALSIYGDMDISTIKELPKGRIPIKTYIKKNDEIKDVLEVMYETLKRKEQIYVIAPLIEENDINTLTNINDLKNKMELAFGKNFNIGIIHGKMPAEQKDLIMGEFLQNKINILISTTVIEVGVDVPNATMMVIFDAFKFGLSTLHQLRGRVGRGLKESTCILISDTDSKRLSIIEATTDGFAISEEDFKLRGHGDLFGIKQSGTLNFKIADLKEDYKILLQVKKDSMEYLENSKYQDDEIRKRLIDSINKD